MREDGARIPQLRTGGPFPYWHSGCRNLSMSMKSSQPKGQHEPGEGRLVSIVFRHESENEESCAISNLIEEEESDDKIRFGLKKLVTWPTRTRRLPGEPRLTSEYHPITVNASIVHSLSKIPTMNLSCRRLAILSLFSIFLFSSTALATTVLAIDYGSDFIKASLIKPATPFDVLLDKDSKRKIRSSVAWKHGERLFGQSAFNLVRSTLEVVRDHNPC